jgi:NAD(P)-dependent dehydrogenase (short-subunit alcohol dehydrogenase family)
MRFDGRVVLITGGGRGMGRAFALGFDMRKAGAFAATPRSAGA